MLEKIIKYGILFYIMIDGRRLKMKASRNKTIDITAQEGKTYLERCISVKGKTELNEIVNKTICGDTFEVLDHLPEKFVDLLIADPPYNLYKEFGTSKFNKMTDDDYYEYTENWIKKIIPLLKDTASIYVCCDWKSSMIIGQVLKKYFSIQNRITWQREKGRGALSNWKNGMEDIWFATVSNE